MSSRGSATGSSAPARLPESSSHGLQPAGEKGRRDGLIGRTKGGMNTKLHAVADAQGRPISPFVTAGPVSDYSGAAALARAAFQRQSGCWRIGATMPIGSGMR